jgi:hypothetical protein
MKTIINKTNRPLKVLLGRGRVLRLGPRKEGRIATNDAERDSLTQLVTKGDIEIYDHSANSESMDGGKLTGREGGQGLNHARFSGGKRGDR